MQQNNDIRDQLALRLPNWTELATAMGETQSADTPRFAPLEFSRPFSSTLLTLPVGSRMKCSIVTPPWLLVTWTDSWVFPWASIHLWHWWTLPLESLQLSVSWATWAASDHLWIWCALPSLSQLWRVSWVSPLGVTQVWVIAPSFGLAVLSGVWTCTSVAACVCPHWDWSGRIGTQAP